MMNQKFCLASVRKTSFLGTLFAVLSFNLNAAPIELSLTGTITGATGTRAAAGDLGTVVTTELIFDLDPANAATFVFEPADGSEPAESKWYFEDTPYSATISGNYGTLGGPDARVETIDNFNTDSLGNPFGLTGIVDVLSIWGGGLSVDCTGGTIDPITGCSLGDAPVIEGVEFSTILIFDSSWFSGTGENDLPDSLPDYDEYIGIFGNAFFASDGEFVGSNEVTYKPLAASAVPVPATVWLFGPALVGLVGYSMRRKVA